MGDNRRRGGKMGNKICPGMVRLQIGEGTNIYMQVVALVYIYVNGAEMHLVCQR